MCGAFGYMDKYVNLDYPSISETKAVVISLIDVRASNPIRVSYDFDRDGWKMEQATIFEWPMSDQVCDQGWKEVGFAPS